MQTLYFAMKCHAVMIHDNMHGDVFMIKKIIAFPQRHGGMVIPSEVIIMK
jgi:hypothetical protein